MKNILIVLLAFCANFASADNVKDLGPGFLKIPYAVNSHLPAQTLPAGTATRVESQTLTFEFTNPVNAAEPNSFKVYGNPRINSFQFIPPIETKFHFAGVKSSLAGCAPTVQPTVEIYSAGNANQRKVLNAGESLALNAREATQITFNLSAWTGCSFDTLTFEYFLTGNMTTYNTVATYDRFYSHYDPVTSEFAAQLRLPKIYAPIFRYEAENVSIPLLEKDLGQCQFKNSAGWIYDGGPYTSILRVAFKCPNISENAFRDAIHGLENIGVAVTEIREVLAQHQHSPPDRTPDPNWYVDRTLPVYNYRSVELTSLVYPYR